MRRLLFLLAILLLTPSANAQTVTCASRYTTILTNVALVRQQVAAERDRKGYVTVGTRDAILAGLDLIASNETAFKVAGCVVPDPVVVSVPPPTPPTPTPTATPVAALSLDAFEAPLRVVQPLVSDKTKLLWMHYTDNGTPGESLTSLSSLEHHDGAQSLQSHFNQALAGSPSGSAYGSNWQFYFYPYIDPAGTLGKTPNGWHYAREFVSAPYTLGTVNRLKFWIKVPPGTPASPTGYHNFEFGTFHRETADSMLSAESNNWHFYHFADLPYTGEWHQVIIDTHPQHQRGTGGTTEPGDRLHLSTATPNLTYFDLLTGFYLDFPYVSGANGWSVPVDFFMDGFEFYTETRPENVDQVGTLNAVYVPSSHTIRVGWNHPRGDATTIHEVRYSFSDILNGGWASATPAPDGLVAPIDGYEAQMLYKTTAIDVTGKSVVYIAIKPQGATLFRQVAVPVQ